jgi:hypothetical protein
MSGNATYQELGDLKVAFYWDDEFGEQRPALICGDLALTSTRSRDGTVTSEVARRQKDGTWLWVIDRYSVSW